MRALTSADTTAPVSWYPTPGLGPPSDTKPGLAAQPITAPPRLSIVAPCYNEQGCVLEFHRQVTEAAAACVGDEYEIVLVNDGSKDNTLALLHQLADRDPHVVAINLSRNFGHQKALSAGLAFCRGDRVLAIDADLQDPPSLLVDMMALMDAGYDVVYGQRRARAGETAFKTTTAALFYRLLRKLTEIDIPADVGDFRLMSRRAVDILNAMPEQFRFIRGLVSWIGLRQTPILYDRDSRYAGATSYPLGKMLLFAVDAITGFSVVPLRLVSWVGLGASAASVVLFIFTIIQWARGATVVGWTSIAALILIIGGVQLLFLGILGEYVGRIYIEGKRRPLFIVSDIHRAAPEHTTRPQQDDQAAANPSTQVAI
jgi:polyisoprenyl-phosphate glycosyltransferase